MSEEELNKKIEEAKAKGASDEDIAKIFALAFKNGDLTREQFEACLDMIGYGLSEDAKGLSDEELRDKVIVSDENEAQEGMEQEAEEAEAKKHPEAPAAKKPEGSEEPHEEGEKKPEGEEGSEEEDDEEKAYRLANLRHEAKRDREDAHRDETDEEDDEEKAFRLAGLRR